MGDRQQTVLQRPKGFNELVEAVGESVSKVPYRHQTVDSMIDTEPDNLKQSMINEAYFTLSGGVNRKYGPIFETDISHEIHETPLLVQKKIENGQI